MKKTMCRWCGGEMELIPFLADPNDDLIQFFCRDCGCSSKAFIDEPAALAWASQPVPFLPEKIETKYATESDREWAFKVGENCLIDTITAALTVMEENNESPLL